MNNIISILNGLEFLYPNNKFISQIKRTLDMFPETENALVDAVSLGQLNSKIWLIDHLPKNLGTVFICAGWFGTLASLMFERISGNFKVIRSFDVDTICAPVADNMNRPWVMDGWQFKATTLDIMNITYPLTYTTLRANGTGVDLTEMPDTIINTSCEHIENFTTWYDAIPLGTLVVLQSNNYFEIKEHINCSENLTAFDQSAPMTTTLFLGELELPKYTRFMKLGYK